MKYGLIGEKLGHSFSKEIHSKIGNYDYILKEIAPENIKEFFDKKDFLGINVTIPYKQVIIPYLDYVSDSAIKIGAVNTVVNKGGKLYGYNTDYFGARDLFTDNDICVKGKKVLILGSGGTSKTLYHVVNDLGASRIIKVSRTKSDETITYQDAYSLHSDADIIVNTTPVGMYPNTQNSPIDIDKFTHLSGVVDVIYNPLNTKLILDARRKNIKAVGGLKMLAGQAVWASKFFFDKEPDKNLTQNVYKQILKQKQNIVLIGMPSCGKTTVGKILNKLTNKPIFDSDEEIVKGENMQISEIFAKKQESGFREIESGIIEKLSLLSGAIISTGGGAILNSKNVEKLRQNGVIFFIDRPLEKLIATTDRPLSSSVELLNKRYAERYPLYLSSADYVIDASCQASEVAQKILKEFNQ